MYYEIKDGPTWELILIIAVLIIYPLIKMFLNNLKYAKELKEQNDQIYIDEFYNQATESESDLMVFF